MHDNVRPGTVVFCNAIFVTLPVSVWRRYTHLPPPRLSPYCLPPRISGRSVAMLGMPHRIPALCVLRLPTFCLPPLTHTATASPTPAPPSCRYWRKSPPYHFCASTPYHALHCRRFLRAFIILRALPYTFLSCLLRAWKSLPFAVAVRATHCVPPRLRVLYARCLFPLPGTRFTLVNTPHPDTFNIPPVYSVTSCHAASMPDATVAPHCGYFTTALRGGDLPFYAHASTAHTRAYNAHYVPTAFTVAALPRPVPHRFRHCLPRAYLPMPCYCCHILCLRLPLPHRRSRTAPALLLHFTSFAYL